MHIKIPFLAVLIISIFQITLYGIENNEYRTKDFNEILTIKTDEITEVSMTDLSGKEHRTKNPKQIKSFVNYFSQFEYQRFRNDETAYMPKKTITVNFHADDEIDFIIPYGQEVFISHRIYRVKNGTIEQNELLEMFDLLSSH